MTNEYRVAKRTNSSSNNDEESIFLSSSSEEDNQVNYTRAAAATAAAKPATASKYVKSSSSRSSKKYDEYDPENIDDYSGAKHNGKNLSPSGSPASDEDSSDRSGYENMSEDEEEEADDDVAAAARNHELTLSDDTSDEEDNRVLSDFISSDRDDEDAKKSLAAAKVAAVSKTVKPASSAVVKTHPTAQKKPATAQTGTKSQTSKSAADQSVKKAAVKPTPSAAKPAAQKPKTVAAEPTKTRKRSNEDENDMDISAQPNPGKIINLGSGFKIPKRHTKDSSPEPVKSGVTPEKRAKLEPASKAKPMADKGPVPSAKAVPIAKPAAKPAAPAPVKNILQDSSAFMEAFGSTKPKPVAPKPKDDQMVVDKIDGGGGIKSNLSEPVVLKKSANKKKVVWADTSAARPLEQVHHFYLDEAEKALKKSGLVKGADMAKIERLGEKELRFKINNGSYEAEYGFSNEGNSTGAEANSWPAQLIRIDLPDSIIQPEIHSVENEIQKVREANTLAVLVFKQFLPDSPSEPTDDSANKSGTASGSEQIHSKVIPLEDITQQLGNAMNEAKDTASASSSSVAADSTDNHAHSSNFDYQNRSTSVNRSGTFTAENNNGAFNHNHKAAGFNQQQFRNQKQQYNSTSLKGAFDKDPALVPNEPSAPSAAKDEVKADNSAAAASNILNIVSKATVFLQSDEAADKIKQILKQIGSTTSTPAAAAAAPGFNLASLVSTPAAAPVAQQQQQPNSFESVVQALLAVNKTSTNENNSAHTSSAQQLMSIPVNPSDAAADGSDDRSPGYNNNSNKFGNFSNGFRKSKWNSPGNYNDTNSNNNGWNSQKPGGNNYRNNNANLDNNRNVFHNSHKRGMGHRGGYSDFRGGHNNNKGGFGRGNGNNAPNGPGNNGNPRWHNNNNNFNSNRGGRFNGHKGFKPNFNKNNNDDHDQNADDGSYNHRRRSDGDNDNDWSDNTSNFKRGGGGGGAAAGRRNSNNDDQVKGDAVPMPVPPPLPMVKANTTTQGGSWV